MLIHKSADAPVTKQNATNGGHLCASWPDRAAKTGWNALRNSLAITVLPDCAHDSR